MTPFMLNWLTRRAMSAPSIPGDYSKKYLTFIPTEDGTFSFSKDGASYSIDDGTT